jgi:FkbM family methyltransferase
MVQSLGRLGIGRGLKMRDGKTKTLGRRVLSPLFGRPGLQSLFQDMYNIALAGMGYGEGNNPATSGEEFALDYVHSHLSSKKRVAVFDVGANVSEYADRALQRWNNQVDLWCFEPSPSTYGILRARLENHPGITLENLGLSDRTASLVLHTPGDGSKVASVHAGRASRWEHGKTEDVQVRTLDAYCAEHGIDALDHLMLDVEGHELSVLQGASGMLGSRAIRFIQFEFGNAQIGLGVFFRDYWEALGQMYVLYRVIAHGLVPIRGYDETCEVFKRATNYLAELR